MCVDASMADAPPPSAPEPPSYLLEGRYLAEKLVARGDTADVFSGSDTWSGEHVAIRLLRADRMDRAPAFRRMSERLFGTASARLLRAIAMGDDRDGRPYLVAELLMGRDLEKLGRVRWEVACEITRQAAAAIAEMHLHGLHHGALRASTFFVAAANVGGSRVKLLDLGTGDRTATAAKDVRALVAILHRLLVGRPPLPAKVRPTRLLTNVAGAPPALEASLGRWLASEGEGIAAADVANELKAIIDAANSEFWSGGPTSSGAHELPRPSMISMADPDDDED
ncbi:MAG: Protein kinase [Labilithrix sp.]|nr:Protein kinase [Labilithrix sp.]